MVGGMILFWNVVVCLSQQGPNILGVLLSKQFCVLTTLETYGISLDLVLWSVLASGRRWVCVVHGCVYTECVVLCVGLKSSGYSTARSIAILRSMVNSLRFEGLAQSEV